MVCPCTGTSGEYRGSVNERNVQISLECRCPFYLLICFRKKKKPKTQVSIAWKWNKRELQLEQEREGVTGEGLV